MYINVYIVYKVYIEITKTKKYNIELKINRKLISSKEYIKVKKTLKSIYPFKK